MSPSTTITRVTRIDSRTIRTGRTQGRDENTPFVVNRDPGDMESFRRTPRIGERTFGRT